MGKKLQPKFKKGDIVCLFFDKSKRFLIESISIHEDSISYFLIYANLSPSKNIKLNGSIAESRYKGSYEINLNNDKYSYLKSENILCTTHIDEKYLILAAEE